MEYLSPLDASFLELEDEDPHASLAIASIAIVDGPPPSHEEFTAAIRGRLPLVKRYRQRVRRIPFDLGRPVWVDDPGFDLDFHIRRSALAAPGDDAALGQLVGRVMAQRLDRERPLWEYWVIEGLPEGRWALLSKVHHCLVDGIAGNEMYRLLCDPTPEPRPAVPDSWAPRPDPGTVDLTLDALGQLARYPIDQLRLIARVGRTPGALAHTLNETVRGLTAFARALAPAARSSLSGQIGTARRYAVAREPLADIAGLAKARQVSVNDVYLAAVAGAFRRQMLARGEKPTADSVRTLVPVNVRTHQDRTVLDNRISTLLLLLPVELDDPADRLDAVHRRVAELRATKESEAGATLVHLAAQEPFGPIALGMRIAMRLPQRSLVTVTTNVPGPRDPLYLLGRPIREILPYVPIAVGMRVGVSVLTYAGQAAFGVTTDFTAGPDAATFARAIVDELGALGVAPSRAPHVPARARTSRPHTAKPRSPRRSADR
jgi:diacylglycerol O-acyltransferase